MQTWARRGFQAALVTGGVLAAGTGVASAAQTCPDRPSPPLGDTALGDSALGDSALSPDIDHIGDGTPRSSGTCFAGELFAEGSGPSRHRAAVRTLSGNIDPMRDLLPAVENETTREMPALNAQGWIPPRRAPKPASTPQHAETGTDPNADTVRFRASAGRATHTVPSGQRGPESAPRSAARGRHAAPAAGTPAEGFHRSVRWKGPIGDVRKSAGVRSDEETVRFAAPEAPGGLVNPTQDPTVVENLDQPDGIVALWQGVLGQAPVTEARAGLVSPDSVDLASGKLSAPSTRSHTVPHSVLAGALSTAPVRPAPRVDTVPLQVPGEHQDKAGEVPTLPDSAVTAPASAPAPAVPTAREDTVDPGFQAPLPLVGNLHAFGGGQTDSPVSRITQALGGDQAPATARSSQDVPAFTKEPLRTVATAKAMDELSIAKPERDHVTENPFQSVLKQRRAAPTGMTGGMALPLLDGAMPSSASAQEQTLPGSGLNSPRPVRDLDATDVLPVLSGRA